MDTAPDSALDLLSRIDTTTMRHRADHALHALLLTQASLRTGKLSSENSTIARATAYFAEKGPDSSLINALLCQSELCYAQHDYISSVKHALHAVELAMDVRNNQLLAESAGLISDNISRILNEKTDSAYTHNKTDSVIQQFIHDAFAARSAARIAEENRRTERTRIISVCMVIGGGLLLFSFIRHGFRLKRISNMKLENRMQRIMILSDRIRNQKKKFNRRTSSSNKIQPVVESLFKEKWDTINMLCNEYFDKDDSDFSRRKIITRVEQEIKRLGEKKNLKALEKAINKYMDGIISTLRLQCQWLKEDEINIIILILAGMSSKAICLILSLKLSNFYSKKRRIIEKISASDAPIRKKLLEKFA